MVLLGCPCHQRLISRRDAVRWFDYGGLVVPGNRLRCRRSQVVVVHCVSGQIRAPVNLKTVEVAVKLGCVFPNGPSAVKSTSKRFGEFEKEGLLRRKSKGLSMSGCLRPSMVHVFDRRG